MLELLLILAVAVGLVVLVPLLLLKLLLGLLLAVVLIPIRIAAALARAAFAVVGGVFKVLFGVLGAGAFVLAIVAGLLLLPVLPLLALAAGLYLLVRALAAPAPLRRIA